MKSDTKINKWGEFLGVCDLIHKSGIFGLNFEGILPDEVFWSKKKLVVWKCDLESEGWFKRWQSREKIKHCLGRNRQALVH